MYKFLKENVYSKMFFFSFSHIFKGKCIYKNFQCQYIYKRTYVQKFDICTKFQKIMYVQIFKGGCICKNIFIFSFKKNGQL